MIIILARVLQITPIIITIRFVFSIIVFILLVALLLYIYMNVLKLLTWIKFNFVVSLILFMIYVLENYHPPSNP